MWLWVGLVGCGDRARVEALEQELGAAETQLATLEARMAELEAGCAPGAQRAARRAELAERRADDGLPAEQVGDELLTPRAALSDLDRAARLGRALLHRGPDGEYDGYRISAIRRGSVLDRVGLRNGDILTAANGRPLRSMQDATAAWEQVQDPAVSELVLAVTRQGAPTEVHIRLDDVPPPSDPAAEPAE